MSSSGYSGTPLLKKLGIQERSSVARTRTQLAIPEELKGVPIQEKAIRAVDIVLLFATEQSKIKEQIRGFAKQVFPTGAIWIIWPKQASKVPTDIREQDLRDICLPLGLVDNKVCAVSDVWSGLRMVWRKELRQTNCPID